MSRNHHATDSPNRVAFAWPIPNLLPATLLASAITAFAAEPATTTIDPASFDHPVKVACLGDSITQGVGTHTPATESYPSQLQALLGEKWAVTNFGGGGRTLLRKQDPFDIGRALRSKPDVVVIMLGINDSRQQTLDQHGSDLVSDYEQIIGQFKALDTHPKIWICAPVPMFPGQWKLSEDLLSSKVIPAIQQVAKDENVPLIDLHTPFLNEKADFPDTCTRIQKPHTTLRNVYWPRWPAARSNQRQNFRNPIPVSLRLPGAMTVRQAVFVCGGQQKKIEDGQRNQHERAPSRPGDLHGDSQPDRSGDIYLQLYGSVAPK